MSRGRKPAHARKFFETVVLPYEGDECLIWPFCVSTGYAALGKAMVHRLVCIATHGPAPLNNGRRIHAAHECGVKLCVNKRHIFWKTASANSLDRWKHGTMTFPLAKLTEAAVLDIRETVAAGSPYRPLQDRYGVGASAISAIVHRIRWKHL